MSSKVFTALSSGDQFRVQLNNGASRASTETDVRGIVTGAGLPDIVKYDRRTKSGKVLDDTKLILLPAPVETDAWEDTELGATFWGQTLTSTDERYGIEESEQPGIVAGVYRGEKPPMIAEVISDAIALPCSRTRTSASRPRSSDPSTERAGLTHHAPGPAPTKGQQHGEDP